MNSIIRKSNIQKFLVVGIFCIMNFTSNSQNKDIIITVMSTEHEEYHDIQYQSIKINQNVDFSYLIRVYINKSSVVMVDNKPIEFEKTGESIKNLLLSNAKNNFGQITPENISSSSCNLKILIRKSAFTKMDDFKVIMKMVNNTLWDLLKYYSNIVYNKEYQDLSQKQKDNIDKLVPLQNLLAKDNTN